MDAGSSLTHLLIVKEVPAALKKCWPALFSSHLPYDPTVLDKCHLISNLHLGEECGNSGQQLEGSERNKLFGYLAITIQARLRDGTESGYFH